MEKRAKEEITVAEQIDAAVAEMQERCKEYSLHELESELRKLQEELEDRDRNRSKRVIRALISLLQELIAERKDENLFGIETEERGNPISKCYPY